MIEKREKQITLDKRKEYLWFFKKEIGYTLESNENVFVVKRNFQNKEQLREILDILIDWKYVNQYKEICIDYKWERLVLEFTSRGFLRKVTIWYESWVWNDKLKKFENVVRTKFYSIYYPYFKEFLEVYFEVRKSRKEEKLRRRGLEDVRLPYKD